MKKLFLAGCAVLLLATGAAHAIEYQRRLPKPVQKLPAYPPVVCVAPNWATESCADRRAAQYWQERDAKAARLWEEWQQARQQHEAKELIRLKNLRSGATTVLYYEPGGRLDEHEKRWKELAESGDDVEIRGPCFSGCTMIMAYVPRERLCFAWGASLRFHMAGTGSNPSIGTAQYMLSHYPQDIRIWLRDRGGVEKMTIEKFWVLDASELWEMGYQRCGPEKAPVPMTKKLVTCLKADGSEALCTHNGILVDPMEHNILDAGTRRYDPHAYEEWLRRQPKIRGWPYD